MSRRFLTSLSCAGALVLVGGADGVASAAEGVLAIPRGDGPVVRVGTGPRDDSLMAVGSGVRPRITLERRRTPDVRSGWVLQDFGPSGAALGPPRSFDAVRRQTLTHSDPVSPDNRWIVFASSDDEPRHRRELGAQRLRLGVAGLRTLRRRSIGPVFRGAPAIGWSPRSDVLWAAGRRTGEAGPSLWSIDLSTGHTRRRVSLPHAPWPEVISVSPTGGHIAYESLDRTWIVDTATGAARAMVTPSALAAEGMEDVHQPLWSPAASSLLAEQEIGFDTLVVDPFSAGPPVRLDVGPSPIGLHVAWAPDGTTIAATLPKYVGEGRGRGFDVYLIDPSTGRARKRVTVRAGNPFGLRWSPDGRWIALTVTS